MTSAASEGQQFCLRWNNYQNNLTNVFEQLLQNEALVDVTLACDGESLKCHKMILSACSPFFQNLFFENPCTHPIVILKDIRLEELKAVVEFMYRGEINVSQNQLNPLLKVASALKVRGLADVSQKPELVDNLSKTSPVEAAKGDAKCSEETEDVSPGSITAANVHQLAKRRRTGSTDKLAVPDEETSRGPSDYLGGDSDVEHSASSFLLQELDSPSNLLADASPSVSFLPSLPNSGMSSQMSPIAVNGSNSSSGCHGMSVGLAKRNVSSATSSSILNEMELRPGIVEMIREEERAKLLESSFTWSKGPRNSITENYQYPLQSAWQKGWNHTSMNITPPMRFRERGPLKSWRPETMAEAVFSVLREGLSLSQAARKFDIPYPTFVLYANRVHNMLGPSADPSNGVDPLDIRPKGRGRPQRILLGTWPEEHVRGVIRAVVFRDPVARDREDFPSFSREGVFNHSHFTIDNDVTVVSQPSSASTPFAAPGPSFSSRTAVVDHEVFRPSVTQSTRDNENFPAETLTSSKCCSSQSHSIRHDLHSHLVASEVPDSVKIKAEVLSYSDDSSEYSSCRSGNPQVQAHQPSLGNIEINKHAFNAENRTEEGIEGISTSQELITFDNMS